MPYHRWDADRWKEALHYTGGKIVDKRKQMLTRHLIGDPSSYTSSPNTETGGRNMGFNGNSLVCVLQLQYE
jgi:hypothetical protein